MVEVHSFFTRPTSGGGGGGVLTGLRKVYQQKPVETFTRYKPKNALDYIKAGNLEFGGKEDSKLATPPPPTKKKLSPPISESNVKRLSLREKFPIHFQLLCSCLFPHKITDQSLSYIIRNETPSPCIAKLKEQNT